MLYVIQSLCHSHNNLIEGIEYELGNSLRLYSSRGELSYSHDSDDDDVLAL